MGSSLPSKQLVAWGAPLYQNTPARTFSKPLNAQNTRKASPVNQHIGPIGFCVFHVFRGLDFLAHAACGIFIIARRAKASIMRMYSQNPSY
jgi:hypothetical protein